MNLYYDKFSLYYFFIHNSLQLPTEKTEGAAAPPVPAPLVQSPPKFNWALEYIYIFNSMISFLKIL